MLGLALFHFLWEALGMGFGPGLSPRLELGTWLLESMGLTTLFLLIRDSERSRWFAGLATGWIAWVFRGPALVLSLAGAGALPNQSALALAGGWLMAYTVCGLILAALAGKWQSADLNRMAETESSLEPRGEP